LNYLHPRVLAMLPAQRSGFTRFYSLLCAECSSSRKRDNPQAWTMRTQASFARAVGVHRRNVKRYEQVLRDLQLIEVQHPSGTNRRSIRVRELDDVLDLGHKSKRLPSLKRWGKEWGRQRPQVGGASAPVSAALSTRPVGRTSLKTPFPPERPASSAASGRGVERARPAGGPNLSLGTQRARTVLAATIDLHRRYFATLTERLVELERLWGPERLGRFMRETLTPELSRHANPKDAKAELFRRLNGCLRKGGELAGSREGLARA